jgi:hypothetical protein
MIDTAQPKATLYSKVNSTEFTCSLETLRDAIIKNGEVPEALCAMGADGSLVTVKDADISRLGWEVRTESHLALCNMDTLVLAGNGSMVPVTGIGLGDVVMTENGPETVFHSVERDGWVPMIRSDKPVLVDGVFTMNGTS